MSDREISIELEEHIKREFSKIKPLLEERVKEITIKHRYMTFFIDIDGVSDMVRYDTLNKRFDQIEVIIATTGISQGFLPNTVYCDGYKKVILPI